jgi:DNA-binding CsgD family transcriptional regulator
VKHPTARLTPNEVEILSRLAEGGSVAEIAESWGRSKTAVYRQLESARRALGAKSDAHAVALFLNSCYRMRRNGRPALHQGVTSPTRPPVLKPFSGVARE